jgi:hypothetical protein
MSFIKNINNSLQQAINDFTKRVEQECGVSQTILLNIWKSTDNSYTPKTSPLTDIDTTDVSPETLLKCTKNELSALCKKQNIKCTGNKSELITRLCAGEKKKEDIKAPVKISKNKTSNIIKKLSSTIQPISVTKNKFNNHEHAETGLVFDQTGKVIGKQNENGEVKQLSYEDIDICNKFKFPFIVPENLNKLDEKDDTILDLDDEIVSDDEEELIEMILEDDDDDDEVEEEYYEEVEEVEEEEDDEDN